MTDLATKFRTLDVLEPPDLWSEAERRRPGSRSMEPPQTPTLARRLGIVAAALVIAAAGFAFAVRAFDGSGRGPQPGVAPNNGAIAYVGTGTRGELSLVQPDGSGATSIRPDVRGFIGAPSWSPDGSRIVFSVTSYDEGAPKGGNTDIYVADSDGTDVIRLTSTRVDHNPHWSPDGGRIAYLHGWSDQQIWLMNTDGTSPHPFLEGPGEHSDFSWSPDGTRIAFTSNQERNNDVYVANVGGSGLVRLTEGRSYDAEPEWSPDGQRIAFVSDRGDPGIYLMDPDGGNVTQLLPVDNFANLWMSWSPDGTQMAVVGTSGPERDRTLYLLDIMTLELTPIAGPGDICCPAWQQGPSSNQDAGPQPTVEESRLRGFTRPDPRITADIKAVPYPWEVAYGDGSLWVAGQINTRPADSGIVRIDPATGERIASIPVGSDELVYAFGAVWTTDELSDGGRGIYMIDPRTNEVTAQLPTNASYLTPGEDRIWAVSEGPSDAWKLVGIDPLTNEIETEVPFEAEAVTGLAVGERAIWVLRSEVRNSTVLSGDVLRVDPESHVVTGVQVEAVAGNIAAGAGGVWVMSWTSSFGDSGTGSDDRILAVRIDPASNSIDDEPIRIRDGFSPFTTDASGVWFSTGGEIAHLDMNSREVDASVALEQSPAQRFPVSAVLDASTRTIWVANYERTVTRIDLN